MPRYAELYHCQILYYDCAGVLCGNCRDGYGVSVLLNKCVTCHDASGILIVVLSESQKQACSIRTCFMAKYKLAYSSHRCAGTDWHDVAGKSISCMAVPLFVLLTGELFIDELTAT